MPYYNPYVTGKYNPIYMHIYIQLCIYIYVQQKRQGFGHCLDQNKMEGPSGRTKVEISVQLTVFNSF